MFPPLCEIVMVVRVLGYFLRLKSSFFAGYPYIIYNIFTITFKKTKGRRSFKLHPIVARLLDFLLLRWLFNVH